MRSLLACGLLAVGVLIAGPFFRNDDVSAGTAIRLSMPDMAYHAGLIVEGRVLSAEPVEVEGILTTEYLVEVERTFYGADRTYRTFRLPGGVRPDGSGMLLAGMPRVAPGDRSLLFLTDESANGMRMPVGLAQGKLDVVRLADGSKRLVRDASDVTLIHPRTGNVTHTQGRSVYDYAQVVAQIETGIARKRQPRTR